MLRNTKLFSASSENHGNMWYITNNKTQHVYYLVSQSIGHTVGRTGTDLIITGDDSISRNHAMLQPHKNVLHLTDTGSRYGSYVNDNIAKTVPISKDQPTALKAGDTVRFGRCGSVWTVGKADFRCLTSTLAMDEALKVVLQKIGAELVSTYTAGLTHLIMPTITVTTKFLQCLIGQVPIVEPEFFHTIDRDCIGQGKALPSVNDFVPTCTESYIRNERQLFHPNPVRSNLFKGKEFIFLNTAQYGQFESIVKLAGGVCLSAQQEKIAKGRFLKPNVITIKLKTTGSSQSQSQSLDTLSQYIASRGRRMVPDLEIGLALMFCSTEKYCNPEYNFAFNVEECFSSGEGGETLAKNTEQQTEGTDTKISNVAEMHTIPETEPHTEPKREVLAKGKKPTAGSSKANNVSTRSISSFLVPKVVIPPIPSVPEERRKSKRMQEAAKDKEQTDEFEDCSLPKRSRKDETPVESVSYSPIVVDSKLAESSEREASELIVPETQPTPDSALSQALQARGFRAVTRNSMDTGGKEATKTRRAANLHHKLDDEDMFNFDEIAPRKKQRIEKVNEKPASNGASTSQARRTNRPNATDGQENLFCFDEIPTTQQRRTANQRQAKQTVSPDALNNNVSNGSTHSSDASLSRVAGVQNRSNSNDLTANSYRAFIKPVQPSAIGWLSSTMCGLKVADEQDNVFSEMKIKSEPLDETDDPYGAMQKDCKQWIKSMENAFPVREISMKLVAHRPVDVSGQEVPCVASDGGKNFKAFVKKRNYPTQQLVLSTKSVCVRDENQCA